MPTRKDIQHDRLLVLVSDRGYLNFSRQVFYAAHRYGNWKGEYALITGDTGNEDLSWFKQRNIHILDLPPVTKRKINQWPPVIFQKLYLLHPVMKRWKQVVYLDTDILIQRDINPLARYGPFAAHTENGSLSIRGQLLPDEALTGEGKALLKELSQSYNLKRTAFNVGVMAFYPHQLEEGLFEKAKSLMNRYEPLLRLPEQALFNLVFYRQWKKIPATYNDYTYYKYSDISNSQYKQLVKSHSYILHFIGKNKPWHRESYFYPRWHKNLSQADSMPHAEQTGDNPGKATVLIRRIYRNIYLIYMYLAHLSWLTGRLMQNNTPGLYRVFKKYKP